ncbi:TetR/AcrR family transcriptional regulator [Nocardia farcinica]|uniref:TetR/AcrR family transcriptional regulator n=2 Tax=Nocardia farcinica TaxID=37329 RepID=UPI002457521A|nr:TetR family transcriptional regulator [Nocardia farcinica]
MSVTVKPGSASLLAMGQGHLREVSRRAARTRIAEIAEELFLRQGFEATTVDAIAAAVGMSQRTFFRYFGSKDDVVLDNYERMGETMIQRLRARPVTESEWIALRRAFDVVAEQYADPDRRARGAMVQQIVEASPNLVSGWLERLDRIQRRLAEELTDRAARLDSPLAGDPVAIRAVVGAAFACLQAVVSDAARTHPDEVGTRLDTVMATIRPTCFG